MHDFIDVLIAPLSQRELQASLPHLPSQVCRASIRIQLSARKLQVACGVFEAVLLSQACRIEANVASGFIMNETAWSKDGTTISINNWPLAVAASSKRLGSASAMAGAPALGSTSLDLSIVSAWQYGLRGQRWHVASCTLQ